MMMMRFEEQASHPPGLTANEGVNISQRALPPTLPSTLPPASARVHRLLLLKVCLDMEKPWLPHISIDTLQAQRSQVLKILHVAASVYQLKGCTPQVLKG